MPFPGGILSHPSKIEGNKSVSRSTFCLRKCAREEKTIVLSLEKELNELPDISTNIFKKSNIDQYIDRTNALFSGEKL